MIYNIFYTIIIVIALISCHEQRDNGINSEDIYKAEDILYQHPDSALAILEQIPISEISNKADKATWALLVTQAKYKLYINQTDSLINVAYNYFINKDNSLRKSQVLYYKAVIKKESQQIEEAQELLLEAKKEASNCKDYELSYLISSNLGNIYAYRELNDYALEAYKQAYDYSIKCNNHLQTISSLIYLGRIHGILNDTLNSFNNYKKAIKLSIEKKELIKYAATLTELSGRYSYYNKNTEAIQLIKEALNTYDKLSKEPNDQLYLVMGNVYRNIGIQDSALFNYNKALESSNIYTQRDVNIKLFYLHKDKRNYKESIDYLEAAWTYNDSIIRLDKSNTLIEMQEKYNRQVAINEYNKLKLEDKQKNIIFLLFTIITIVIISLIIFLSQKRIIHQKNIINKVNEDIRLKSEQIQNNETIIKRNQIRISELEAEMNNNYHIQIQNEAITEQVDSLQKRNNELVTNNAKLKDEIKSNSLLIKDKTKQIKQLNNLFQENQRLIEREQFLSEQLIQNIQVFNELRKSPKYIGDYQWKKIEINMNYYFDNFTDRLKQRIPTITDSDIQICYLIKLHINNSAIATMLAISPTSVTKRKQRLKERILQEIERFEDGQTLEMWLYEL